MDTVAPPPEGPENSNNSLAQKISSVEFRSAFFRFHSPTALTQEINTSSANERVRKALITDVQRRLQEAYTKSGQDIPSLLQLHIGALMGVVLSKLHNHFYEDSTNRQFTPLDIEELIKSCVETNPRRYSLFGELSEQKEIVRQILESLVDFLLSDNQAK